MVVSVYICSAVSIILRIQMSILGGILLHKQQVCVSCDYNTSVM